MSIPLITNLGFVEISSAGNLNSAMGGVKSKLPIQYFKLAENITGNLTLDNDSSHKKIILDTNGKNIINGSGSPITSNSSATVEVKGSGDVQSTLKTFTKSEDSTTNSGTTTLTLADDSTISIGTGDHTFIGHLVDDNRSPGGGVTFGDGATNVLDPGESFALRSFLVNEHYYNTATATALGGTTMPNANRADFGMTFTHAFLEDGTPISGALTGPGGPSSLEGRTSPDPSTNSLLTLNGVQYRYMKWNSAIEGVNNGNSGTFAFFLFINANNGLAVLGMQQGRGAFNQIKNVDIFGSSPGRRFTYVNNLATPVVLSGNDPYNNVTVTAGASAVFNRDSTDGSFDITGTVSGNNSDGEPFSVKAVNDGTGTVNTDGVTGNLSASAF